MERFRKYRHLWMIPAYMVCYMAVFAWLEKRRVSIHIIHTAWDEYIPFCKYFIIPYLLWFAFVAAVVVYFALIEKDREEYYRLVFSLGTGMTLFLAVSYFYPNGHNLRLALQGNDILIQVVRALYLVDTPTNILPSIHVFNTVVCLLALWHNERCRQHRLVSASVFALSVLIVLSTMFLKQHSVVDVVMALLLNTMCYQLFYRVLPAREPQVGRAVLERYS